MGMIDRIRNFFKGSNNEISVQQDDTYQKSELATQIVNLVDKIKRVNSFDSSIWNLSNISNRQLEEKSLEELQIMCNRLNSRFSELTRQSQRTSSQRESLEAAKWTGQKPQNLTNYEFDRFQRDDER